jgi:putative addiction module killer protein
MLTLIRSARFETWLRRLPDQRARAKILTRLTAAAQGHFGDCKSVGEGVSEMRIHTGPGYRLYFTRTDVAIYVFLVGGDKSSRPRDIETAKTMARSLGANNDER